MTPQTVRSAAVFAGSFMVSAGAAMIYQPAGLIVGGMLLLVMGLIGHLRGGNQ